MYELSVILMLNDLADSIGQLANQGWKNKERTEKRKSKEQAILENKNKRYYSYRIVSCGGGGRLNSRHQRNAHLGSILKMYMSNFIFLVQFGCELYEELTQKIRKTNKAQLFWDFEEVQ